MGRPDFILPFDAAVIQMNVHNRDSAEIIGSLGFLYFESILGNGYISIHVPDRQF